MTSGDPFLAQDTAQSMLMGFLQPFGKSARGVEDPARDRFLIGRKDGRARNDAENSSDCQQLLHGTRFYMEPCVYAIAGTPGCKSPSLRSMSSKPFFTATDPANAIARVNKCYAVREDLSSLGTVIIRRFPST
jgi:hypothetical protein